MNNVVEVSNVSELTAALSAMPAPGTVVVSGVISGLPSLTLPAGTSLQGGRLEFTGRGLNLTKDNLVKDTTLIAAPHEIVIRNDTEIPSAGVLRFENVTVTGQVLLLADDELRDMRVEVDSLSITEADLRARELRPRGYGVEVLQGAFTLWNRHPDPAVHVTATIDGLSAGTEETPVRGTGIFVAGKASGQGQTPGGGVSIDRLATGPIHTDGGIEPGTPDVISGGVFVLGGAHVKDVLTQGAVITHGQNDMVLDLWGEADRWTASAPLSSTGPSGIGVVIFGSLGELRVEAPIVTEGRGARGFNLYDGYVGSAYFESITTHGDGAIGIQLSKPMGPIEVGGDIVTTGGIGMSLVKGVQTELRASAISLKAGTDIPALHVRGSVRTEGAKLTAVEVLDGATVGELTFDGGIHAEGADSNATSLEGEVRTFQALQD